MQRMPPNIPPRQSRDANPIPASPALNMARRIRSEQGAEQARQYLMDMEPYLAPAERNHIASQIGVNLPRQQQGQPVQHNQQQFPSGAQPGGNPLAMLGGLGGGNPMQLLQMLGGGLGGGAANGGGTNGGGAPGGMPGLGGIGNIMQMAQMMQTLGPLLGGKK